METMMRTSGLDALVRASRTVNTPPQDARERNRSRLAGRIAAGVGAAAAAAGAREAAAAIGGGATPGAVAGGSTALAGGFAKWAVVSLLIAAGGGTGVGVYLLRNRAPAAPTFAAPLPAPPEPLTGEPLTGEPLTGEPLTGEPPAPSPTAAPTLGLPPGSDAPAGSGGEPRARPEPSAAPGGSTAETRAFDRELQLLRSARRALDTGSPALALALLDRYAAEFPRGTLKSECQAARILALCAAGRVASAKQARDQFLKQQPGSPLAEQLRTTCGNGR
jgi:hypothetical protein